MLKQHHGIGTFCLVKLKLSLLSSAISLSLLSTPVYATDATNVQQGADSATETIVITGTRIEKEVFHQEVPVQVLNVELAIKAGVSTVAQLLQRTSMAAGQQFDPSYNSGSGNIASAESPPNGGVGSINIGLRGLDAERTLILLNGRRLGASGVRGAPSQPDISLLPLNVVDRVEIITEGASSIYGADAVAGVVNVILKSGYDGTEFSANVSKTKDGGGDIRQFSFVSGSVSDKSSYMLSASYYDRKTVSVGQRIDDCMKRMFRGEDGTVYTHCYNPIGDNFVLNSIEGNSGPNGGDSWVFYTPGETNIGVDNFSTGLGLPLPEYDDVRIDGNGHNRYRYDATYNTQRDILETDLIQPATHYTLSFNGNTDVDWFGGDESFFYEAYYFHRHLTNVARAELYIPTIAGMIPHEDANGNLVTNEDGSLDLVDNPLNPFSSDSTVVVTLEELPQQRDVELDHVRFVAGLRGDFTSELLADKGWNYEIHASYDRGMGHQSQPILHEEHLFIANETLRLDVDGNPICGLTPLSADYGGILTLQECVVVDWFAPNIFGLDADNHGNLGSEEARDYLVATRTNRTVVEQVVLNGFATGELFDFDGGGTAMAAFGAEYRKDDIWSAADYLGANGGHASTSPLTEGETIGSRSINSVFAELSLPIITERQGINLLELETAIRFTDESNFGNETTHRTRLTYKPMDALLFSASYGTSFRAPNLREQFLTDQFQGVSGFSDPCAVPNNANEGGSYNAQADNRPQTVIDNCIISGAVPTELALDGVLTIPVTVDGNVDGLMPETATNMSYSIKLNPDLGEKHRVNVALTYYDIEIKDTIRTINGETIMARCYNDEPNLASPFCSRVSRDNAAIDRWNFVSAVDASFLNVGVETSKGFDINIDYGTHFSDVFGQALTLAWSNQYSQMTEREVTIFAGETPEDLIGDFGYAKHRLLSHLSLSLGDFEWMIVGRYMSGTHADDITTVTAACDRFVASTDLLLADGSRPNIQPICQAGGAFYVDTSLTFDYDDLRITAGVNNLFDKQAPLIAREAGSNRANLVTSSGYDLNGQSYFLRASYSF